MTDTNFKIADRKIDGDITATARPPKNQRTPAEFLAAVDAILAVPGVEAIRWRQYTPYFNDGEPCEFSVNDLYYTKLPNWANFEDSYDEDSDDDSDEEYYDYDDGFIDTWGLSRTGRDADKHPAGLVEALALWDSDGFESVARENFGDHAIVTATPEGFSVEYYDHD